MQTHRIVFPYNDNRPFESDHFINFGETTQSLWAYSLKLLKVSDIIIWIERSHAETSVYGLFSSEAALSVRSFRGEGFHLIHLSVATFYAHQLLEFQVDIVEFFFIDAAAAASAHEDFHGKYPVPGMELFAVGNESAGVLGHPLCLLLLIGIFLLPQLEVEMRILQAFLFLELFLRVLIHYQLYILKVVHQKLCGAKVALEDVCQLFCVHYWIKFIEIIK